ncbi:MAG: hypothetical protein ACRENU_07425 [Gemmatimonadaceae bacterium]
MRSALRRTVGSALAFALAACDATGPGDKDVAEFILDFCSDETPDFVAFQTDGGPWTRVIPSAGGTVTIQATEKFGLAVSDEDEDGPFTDVVYGTLTEFSSLNGVTCLEQFGARTLNGSASGLTGTQTAEITMGFGFDIVTAGAPQFQLLDLPDRPLDIVAMRVPNPANAVPDRAIVRRAVVFSSGAALSPPLDLAAPSPGSEAIATNTLTVTGLVAGESNFATSSFRTASGTWHTLRDASFATSTVALYGIPSSLTQQGDVHETFVVALSSNSETVRGVTQYHRNPGDRTAALGTTLHTPVVTNAAQTPAVRLRAELVAQADYGGFASADFTQSEAAIIRHFSVTETSGFNGGTPATWVLEMPDLAGVTGFPGDGVFVTGAANEWFVEAGSAGADIFVGGAPANADGLVIRFADRLSAPPMALSRTADARPSRRSPLLRALSPRR